MFFSCWWKILVCFFRFSPALLPKWCRHHKWMIENQNWRHFIESNLSFKFRLIFFHFFFVYFFVIFFILSVWIIFYFSQINQIVVFFKFLFNIIRRIFYSNYSKKIFVIFSFKTVNLQTLNAILIKSNYQKIRQKIDFFFVASRIFSYYSAAKMLQFVKKRFLCFLLISWWQTFWFERILIWYIFFAIDFRKCTRFIKLKK